MSLFKDMLRSGETLFSNELALDFDFVPKKIPYREGEQEYVAGCIAPLLKGRNGKNLFVYGSPGIGKTASMKWILRDLEDTTEEVEPIYINCWQKNTTYKIILEICELVGYRFTHNKKTDDLFKVVKEILNKRSAVFVFDEVDKLEDFDFLYSISEEIFKKTLILITNYKEWLMQLDDRIKSRISCETLEFPKYRPSEVEGILRERVQYAFRPDVWEPMAFDEIVDKAVELGDVRQGIYLLRQAGLIAEGKSSRLIKIEHAKEATSKISSMQVKSSIDLEDDTKLVLSSIKDNSGQKIGEIFRVYKERGGKNGYKTFQRKVEKLEKGNFIETYKTSGGEEGNTTIIKYKGAKTLSDF